MKGIHYVWHYLRGKRNGKAANCLERDALSDPFLYEAIEGMSAVDADHEKILDGLNRRLQERTKPKNGKILYRWGVAASFLLLAGLAVWLASVPEVEMTDQLAVVQVVDSIFETESLVASVSVSAVADSGSGNSRVKESPGFATFQSPSIPDSQVVVGEGEYGDFEIEEDAFPKQAVVKDLSGTSKVAGRSGRSVDTVREKGTAEGMSNDKLVSARIHVASKKSLRVRGGQVWQQRFESYVTDSLRYPEEARKAKVQGDVQLSIRLNKRGHPVRIKVIKELSPACDREAMRLVEFYDGVLGEGKNQRIELTVSFRLKQAD